MLVKKIFLILYIFHVLLSISSQNKTDSYLKIGMARVSSPFYKFYQNEHLQIEDILLSNLADLRNSRQYALQSKISIRNAKIYLNMWKKQLESTTDIVYDNPNYNSFINEIKDLDFCIVNQITNFEIKEENDFYDSSIIYFVCNINIYTMVIDCKNKQFFNQELIKISEKSKITKEDAIKKSLQSLTNRYNSFLTSIVYLKNKIYLAGIPPRINKFKFDKLLLPKLNNNNSQFLKNFYLLNEKNNFYYLTSLDKVSIKDKNRLTKIFSSLKIKNNIFIWVMGGKNLGLTPGDLLVSYRDSKFSLEENKLLRVAIVKKKYSLVNILYDKNNKNKINESFTKKNNINLTLKLLGGFSLSDSQNNVDTLYTQSGVSILGYASIRILIPVKVAFFRPVVQTELNFFTSSGTFLLPFTFEVGGQGELRLRRFEMDVGFMIGALFSPNASLNYQIDSVSLRPYIDLSVLAIDNLSFFTEFGYRFFLEGILYKNWKIDLKGVYFSFGIGLNF